MGLINFENNRVEQQTVLVGVKLDSNSRELLTWALVKVAKPGDRVIALHVLKNNQESNNSEGKSTSLLCLVKSFDSVLSVYEGFCNLKQVDLKLKISRGSSVRKALVEEAKTCGAIKVIVGITRTNATGSSISVVKYCARKLSQECSVFAVNNGKVVFQREATTTSRSSGKETDDRPRASFFGALHRSLSKNSKVLSSNLEDLLRTEEDDKNSKSKALNHEKNHDLGNKVLDEKLTSKSNHSLKSNCSICVPEFEVKGEEKARSHSSDDQNCNGSSVNYDQSREDKETNPLALVPVQTLEAASSSISLLIREMPELRPGWPLLRRAILPNREASRSSSSFRQISVVQWAMRLPNRHSTSVHPDNQNPQTEAETENAREQEKNNLDGENGAIVPVNIISPQIDDEKKRKIPKELESLHEKYASTCRLFTYEELLVATSKFSSENLIGKGGSSRVYKGCLSDGKELAVKILKPSENAWKEFVLEIEIITTLNHKNIISLFGFCFEDDNLLLVYEFLSRGSLEENLHGNKDKFVLSWAERYKVALGIAEALDYLHTRVSQPVIHRDVKSSNILLSEEFEPQLSDFGLAKWASSNSSYITCSDVAGTFGYLAPEYFMYGRVNEKIDVYSFGVVLLELLSGRKPISSGCPKGQESLVMWAMPLLQSEKVTELFDPSLGDKYDNGQMQRLMLAASLCIRRSPRFRPRMGVILKLLQGDDDVAKWARIQVKASEEFDGLDDETFQSPDIQSHLNLALLDVEDDSLSIGSMDAHKSFEDYLQGRWSRSPSFD